MCCSCPLEIWTFRRKKITYSYIHSLSTKNTSMMSFGIANSNCWAHSIFLSVTFPFSRKNVAVHSLIAGLTVLLPRPSMAAVLAAVLMGPLICSSDKHCLVIEKYTKRISSFSSLDRLGLPRTSRINCNCDWTVSKSVVSLGFFDGPAPVDMMMQRRGDENRCVESYSLRLDYICTDRDYPRQKQYIWI